MIWYDMIWVNGFSLSFQVVFSGDPATGPTTGTPRLRAATKVTNLAPDAGFEPTGWSLSRDASYENQTSWTDFMSWKMIWVGMDFF